MVWVVLVVVALSCVDVHLGQMTLGLITVRVFLFRSCLGVGEMTLSSSSSSGWLKNEASSDSTELIELVVFRFCHRRFYRNRCARGGLLGVFSLNKDPSSDSLSFLLQVESFCCRCCNELTCFR